MKKEIVTLKITTSYELTPVIAILMESDPKAFQEYKRKQRDLQIIKMISDGVLSSVPENQKKEFARKVKEGKIELSMLKISDAGEKRIYEQDYKVEYDVIIEVLIETKED